MDMALALAKQPETQISDKLVAFTQFVLPQLQESLDGEDLYPFEDMISEIKDNQYAAFSLYMPEYNWQLALNLLVAAANKYSLVVFFQEAVMAFAPPDRIFPQQAEPKWNTIKNFLASSQFPTTTKQFKKWFAPSLDAMFSQHGFVMGDVDEIDTSSSLWTVVYTKKVAIGIQYAKVYCHRVHNGFDVSVRPSMQIDYLSHIYNKFDFDKPRYRDGTLENTIFSGDFLISILKIPANDIVICNQISALRLINIVNSKLMPLYESACTLKGLDEALNGEIYPYFRTHVQSDWLKPYCLIVARLANNPNFESLVIDLPKTRRNSDGLITCWPEFVKYLRYEIDPDAFFKEFVRLKAKEKRLEDARVQVIQDHFNPKTHDELVALAGQWQEPDTGLIWQRHCMGQHWQDGQVVGTAKVMTWRDAKDAAKRITDFDWRLPTDIELEAMMLPNQTDYPIEKIGIFGLKEERLYGAYWALFSSPREDYESCVIFFKEGRCGLTDRVIGGEGCVLLVRSP
jgi:hypothetical protein